ncbi:unnamed protein product, partial [Symbiodinium natans]
MGWRHYQNYPPPALPAVWQLGAAFELARKAESGEDQPDLGHSYLYDPARPTPAAGGPSFNPMNAGARDQAKIEAGGVVVMFCSGKAHAPPPEARSDVLVYTSDALQSPLLIAGPIHLKLE